MAVVTETPGSSHRTGGARWRKVRLLIESLFRPDATLFRQLCRVEPRLHELYAEACAVQYDPGTANFCATVVFYDHFRPRVDALLDEHARRTGVPFDQNHYRAVYRQIHRALPRCRRCTCW